MQQNKNMVNTEYNQKMQIKIRSEMSLYMFFILVTYLKVSHLKPERRFSLESDHSSTWISDFQTLELWK